VGLLSITNRVGLLDGASTGAREPESTGFDDLGSAEAIASYGRWSIEEGLKRVILHNRRPWSPGAPAGANSERRRVSGLKCGGCPGQPRAYRWEGERSARADDRHGRVSGPQTFE
jgi:hypothetical protein